VGRKMTVEQVRAEYKRAIEQVSKLPDEATFLHGGRPISAFGIRHYPAAMQVLFDRIEELEKVRK